MSQLRPPFRRKISFTIRKTKPRKVISRSPLKFSAENLARELGPIYQTVDVRIGTQRMTLDTTRGGWTLGNFESIYFIVYSFFLSLQMKQRSTLRV
jgi:hypothetical protein